MSPTKGLNHFLLSALILTISGFSFTVQCKSFVADNGNAALARVSNGEIYLISGGNQRRAIALSGDKPIADFGLIERNSFSGKKMNVILLGGDGKFYRYENGRIEELPIDTPKAVGVKRLVLSGTSDTKIGFVGTDDKVYFSTLSGPLEKTRHQAITALSDSAISGGPSLVGYLNRSSQLVISTTTGPTSAPVIEPLQLPSGVTPSEVFISTTTGFTEHISEQIVVLGNNGKLYWATVSRNRFKKLATGRFELKELVTDYAIRGIVVSTEGPRLLGEDGGVYLLSGRKTTVAKSCYQLLREAYETR